MLSTLRDAFKVKDLRTKLLYTFAMLVVIRLGSNLTIPGVNNKFLRDFISQQQGNAFGFVNALDDRS